MQRFKSDERLHQHLEQADCLQPSSYLDPPVKTSLPLSLTDNSPPRLMFTAQNKKLEHPVCVYMDYETYWDAVDAPEVEPNHAYTAVVGRNTRVASYAYSFSAISGFDVPPSISSSFTEATTRM